MSVFAILAKAKLDIESIKGSYFVVVRHYDRSLVQTVVISSGLQHNLLYRTWTAGLQR
jgi:hypothetical protein